MKQWLLITSIFITSSLMAMKRDPGAPIGSFLPKRTYAEIAKAPLKKMLPPEYVQLSKDWTAQLAEQKVNADQQPSLVICREDELPAFNLLEKCLPLALLIHRSSGTSWTEEFELKQKLETVTEDEVTILQPFAGATSSSEKKKEELVSVKLGQIANLANRLGMPIITTACLRIFKSKLQYADAHHIKSTFLDCQEPEEFNPFYLDKEMLKLLTREILDEFVVRNCCKNPVQTITFSNDWAYNNTTPTQDEIAAHRGRIVSVKYDPVSKTIITEGKEHWYYSKGNWDIKLWTYNPEQCRLECKKTIGVEGVSVFHPQRKILVSSEDHKGRSTIKIFSCDDTSLFPREVQSFEAKAPYALGLDTEGTTLLAWYHENPDNKYKAVVYKQDATTAQWVKQKEGFELSHEELREKWYNKKNDDTNGTSKTWLERFMPKAYLCKDHEMVASNAIVVVRDDSRRSQNDSLLLYQAPEGLNTFYNKATFAQALLLRYAERKRLKEDQNLLQKHQNLQPLYKSLDEGALKGSGVLELVAKILEQGDDETSTEPEGSTRMVYYGFDEG